MSAPSKKISFSDLRPLGGGAFSDVSSAAVAGRSVVLKTARRTPRAGFDVTGAAHFARGLEFSTGGVGPWTPEPSAILDREAEILRRVRAPAFVKLLDVGAEEDAKSELRYLVLERIDGATWREALSSPGPTALAAEHVLELARALAQEREAGRLDRHGDLKPENLMLDAEGRVRVLDPSSGMTVRDQDGRAIAFFTTELYDPALSATDLPALGLLLAEVLTGRQLLSASRRSLPEKAFGPELEAELRARAATRSAPMLARLRHMPLPSELRPETPRGLEALALRGLGLGWNGERLERIEPFTDVGAFAATLARELEARPSV